jgi:hypothetical protein
VCGLVTIMYLLTLTRNLGWQVLVPLTCEVEVGFLLYKMHPQPHLTVYYCLK